MFYQLLSMDACNVTGGNVGGKTCSKGGQLVMWQSPALRGARADWQLVGPVWTDNTTVLKDGFLSHEFVTIDMLGTMPIAPAAAPTVPTTSSGNNTFYFLNNVGGDGCCSGTTSYTVLKQPHGPGTPFQRQDPGQQMVDWGSFTLKPAAKPKKAGARAAAVVDPLDLLTGTASRGLSMARTLGSEESDQVTKPGRRVLIGWTGPAPKGLYEGHPADSLGSAQSLSRDLFMDPLSSRLVQAFAAELQTLRATSAPAEAVVAAGASVSNNLPMGVDAIEVVASFPPECGTSGTTSTRSGAGESGQTAAAPCGFEVLASKGVRGVGESLSVTLDFATGLVLLNGTTMKNDAVRAGPIPAASASTKGWTVHAIVDHSIVEVIVNGDTAFVVYVAPSSKDTAGNARVFGQAGSAMKVWKLKDANVN